jgi:undecaprenyl-phosphate galactose phosphotransferase
MLLDIFAYFFTLPLAVLTRTNIPDFIHRVRMPDQAFFFLMWIPLALVVMNQFQRLYRTRYAFWEETRILIRSISISFLVLLFGATVRNVLNNHTLLFVFVVLWFYLLLIIPAARLIGKKLLYRLGVWRENVVIIGAGESGVATLRGLLSESHLGYRVMAFLDDDPSRDGEAITVRGQEFQVFGPTRDFAAFAGELRVETIFVAGSTDDNEALSRQVRELNRIVQRIILVPDIHGVAIFNSEMHHLLSDRLFMIKLNNNLNFLFNIAFKRIFDIVVCVIGLLITWPVFAAIALAVKLTSKGPVIYPHQRVGRGGKNFPAFKFRSMYVDSAARLKKILDTDPEAKREWEASYKLKNDPRVTPIGAFLRKTSLDEIPQVFNILFGHMSLVGPRPVIREEIDKFYGSFREYYYTVKPGLTGLWQVSGRSDTDYATRTRLDAWYVQNWSLWLDITLLLRTVEVVLKRKGAY